MFESSVNSEGIETTMYAIRVGVKFESSVNSEGIETIMPYNRTKGGFESSVNSEGIETNNIQLRISACLRAV